MCFSILGTVQRGLNVLLLPLYVRHVPPADYGVLAAVTIAAALVAVVSNLRLDAAMRTFYFDHCDHPEELEVYLRQVFSASIYFSAIVYLAMLLAGTGIFRIVFVHADVQFLPAGAIALATASVNACLSSYFVYLRNSHALRELIRWQLLIVLGTVFLQFVLVMGLKLGMYGVLWGSLLPTILAALLLCATRPELLSARLDLRYLTPSVRYSLPLVGLGFLYVLGTRLDRLVLERHVDLETLGAYAILAALFGLLNIALNAVDNAIRPYLYRDLRSGGPKATASIVSYQTLYSLGGLLALSIAVFLGTSLHFVTDNAAYLSIRSWLVPAATAFVPVIFTRYCTLFYDFHKRSVALSMGIFARFGALYLLLILLVPPFAIGGALGAIFGSEVVTALVFWLVSRRLFAIRISLQALGTQLILFLGTIWLLGPVFRIGSTAAFGALQLFAVAALLLAANRRGLQGLLTKAGKSEPIAPRGSE